MIPSGAADPNYDIQYNAGIYTINPASLTIEAANETMVYGGTVPTLNVAYSGFVNGDDVSSLSASAVATTTATSASPAGTYPITPNGATLSGTVS